MDRRAAWWLCLAACTSTPAESPRREGTHVTLASRASLDAQDMEWRRIAEEAFKRFSLQDCSHAPRNFEENLRLAVSWRDKGEFEKAWDEAHKAFLSWPEDPDARRLLSELTWMVTGERLVEGRRIAVERALIGIRDHVRRGRALHDAGEFEWAVREFERAEAALKRLPSDEAVVAELRHKVEGLLGASRDAAAK